MTEFNTPGFLENIFSQHMMVNLKYLVAILSPNDNPALYASIASTP